MTVGNHCRVDINKSPAVSNITCARALGFVDKEDRDSKPSLGLSEIERGNRWSLVVDRPSVNERRNATYYI